jgi:hypothetical protein|tara:strand:- start:107 stop:385 length:279 start_codon:yes stop_codon:yes gene_type:complete
LTKDNIYARVSEGVEGKRAMRKSKLMRQVEERYHRPLEKLLPEMYNDMGLPGMAEEMDISRSTVYYWLLRFGISMQRIALAPDESIEVKKGR